jgi:hypothetical protein
VTAASLTDEQVAAIHKVLREEASAHDDLALNAIGPLSAADHQMRRDSLFAADALLTDRDRLARRVEELEAQLTKVNARRQKAKDREDILTGLAARYAVVHEGARRRFSVDGAHWASTPAKAVRAYIDVVESGAPRPTTEETTDGE